MKRICLALVAMMFVVGLASIAMAQPEGPHVGDVITTDSITASKCIGLKQAYQDLAAQVQLQESKEPQEVDPDSGSTKSPCDQAPCNCTCMKLGKALFDVCTNCGWSKDMGKVDLCAAVFNINKGILLKEMK